jgi:pyridoxal 5'-phosphate synthase pdxT subunit
MVSPPRVGVLALQGDFAAHAAVLFRLGARVGEIHHAAEVEGLDGLVLPGGESTTLLHLMRDEPWGDALFALRRRGGGLLGTCAGAILLAKETTGPAQPSFGLLDVGIERNAFGRQVDSFETTLPCAAAGGAVEAVFIRAPRFRRIGPGVEVLARLGAEPVLVREGGVLAMTFHPELTGNARIHRLFLDRMAVATERSAS